MARPGCLPQNHVLPGYGPRLTAPLRQSRSFVWVTADGRLKATPLSVLQKMGGYGALVLDTIGTAVEPILLLIGEENKHHGVLEVLRETIEAFPGVFDDTADMMRHGKARYAVEKGDDGLKYRVLDYDVAPQLPSITIDNYQSDRGFCTFLFVVGAWCSLKSGLV